MDLVRHLRFFAAVAETRHFGQAATTLQMTQPPLSQGIQRLEAHLGTRLFDRDARGVRITAAGRALLPRALDLVAAADELVATAAGIASAEPVIRFGLCRGLGSHAVRAAGALAAAGQGSVEPVVTQSRRLVELVATGEMEIAIVRHPSITDGTSPGEVLQLPTRLVVRRTPGRSAAVHLRDVELPVAVPPRADHPAAHDQLVDTLRRHGHSGDTVSGTDDTTIRALVAAGSAVALSPEATVAGGLRLVDIRDNPVPLRVRVITPATTHRDPARDYTSWAHAVHGALEVAP